MSMLVHVHTYTAAVNSGFLPSISLSFSLSLFLSKYKANSSTLTAETSSISIKHFRKKKKKKSAPRYMGCSDQGSWGRPLIPRYQSVDTDNDC